MKGRVNNMGRKSLKQEKENKPRVEIIVPLDTKSRVIPEQCTECARKDHNMCTAHKKFLLNPCTVRTEDYTKILKEIDDMIAYNKIKGNTSQLAGMKKERDKVLHQYNNQINKCYLEDKHRGSGGGGSKNEGGREVKSLMKDNSAREVKERMKYEREYYKDALNEFEEQHGKLDKLKPDDGVVRSKIDSYTGDEIPEAPKKYKKGNKK